MKVEKLPSADAFVVFDLEQAETSVGVVRLAPKVLVDGATWLARSQTYQFAVFGRRMGGASAGVNAKVDARADAIRGFVADVGPWVQQRRLLLDPGKGVAAADLADLRADDPRPANLWDDAPALRAAGLCAAAVAACGGSLDGRTVAIEGFERGGPELASALADAGARITAVSTASGTAVDARGYDRDRLTGAPDGAPDIVAALTDQPAPSAAVLVAPADVLFVGSKAGVVGHAEAQSLGASVVVPSGPVPVTAKALAVLGRRDVVVLPDFVTTAGPVLAAFPAEAGGDSPAAVDALVGGLVGELLHGEEPPFLAACRRAEAFLASWCDTLPFGRPLA